MSWPPFVVKTLGQQDLQLLGRVRSKIVSQRTELINQVRGLASEYGVSFSKRRQELMAGLPLALEDAENGLSQVARFALLNVFEDIRALDLRLEALALQTEALAKQEPAYALFAERAWLRSSGGAGLHCCGRRWQAVRARTRCFSLAGDGPKTARHWRQSHLHADSKNGDRELRTLLIDGSRAVLRWVDRRDGPMSRWLVALRDRRGEARTIVAFVNKFARIGLAVLQGDQPFDVNKAFRRKVAKSAAAA